MIYKNKLSRRGRDDFFKNPYMSNLKAEFNYSSFQVSSFNYSSMQRVQRLHEDEGGRVYIEDEEPGRGYGRKSVYMENLNS